MSERPATDGAPVAGRPRRLLLATDLSARCDRALDRAALLAREWGAELLALNVLEPVAPDQALAWLAGADEASLDIAARRQLARDLAGIDVRVTVRTARGGDAAAAIRAAADDCGLVVTGVARDETLGRFLLGSTVAKLARSLPQPLLVVRQRPRGPYRRIVIATDFSAPSAHALREAVRLFPDCELILYHASESASGDGEACAAFLAGSGLAAAVLARIRVVVEQGAPESVLATHVRDNDVDLVVLGSQGRSGLMGVLIGSVAARLLDWVPCDTLLVRESRAGRETASG